MKKLITLFLVLVTSIILTACGGGGGDISSGSRGSGSGYTNTTEGVTLSWLAPSTRADGSYLPLTELEGYRIYYGTSASHLNMLVDLNDNSITEYKVDTLPSGNYYFAVTAYDSDGAESSISNMINEDV